MPIQFKYLQSFLPMYVFPLAGKPTITIKVGALTNFGLTAGYVQLSAKNTITWPCQIQSYRTTVKLYDRYHPRG